MDIDEEKIKKSFSKVKEETDFLKTQINELKSLINEVLKKHENQKKREETVLKNLQVPKEEVSTGNQGVYADIHSFIHSFNRHSTDNYSTNMQTNKQEKDQSKPYLLKFSKEIIKTTPLLWSLSNIKEIDNLFSTLTKQEFLTFMLVFQGEEDLQRGISYLELSQRMLISEGCVRTYISQMIKKGIPIQKIRLNNKLTLLLIDKEFRSLNLKSRLSNLFSKSDPNQTTLI